MDTIHTPFPAEDTAINRGGPQSDNTVLAGFFLGQEVYTIINGKVRKTYVTKVEASLFLDKDGNESLKTLISLDGVSRARTAESLFFTEVAAKDAFFKLHLEE